MDVPSKVLPPKEATVSEDVKLAAEPKVEVTEQPKPEVKGSLTSETRLYAALEEERKARKDLEKRLKSLEGSAPSQEDQPEEVTELKDKVYVLEQELAMEKVFVVHPDLKDHVDEFKEFKNDYPGASVEKVAKLFLAEKGLIVPQRKGLEKPTAGSKTAPVAGVSEEDAKRLRETQPRRYIQMLRDGKLNPDHIK